MSDTASITVREESFRVFEGEPHYIDGYIPSSLDSQHSSLLRSATWLGMGFLLAALAGLGTLVFGLATHVYETQEHAMTYIIIGAALTVAFVAIGSILIHKGRANYRAYVAATGRIH
ncbi:hypothetical protein C1Y63_02480 [Corynebacterium sp. 13CS0277]|uniref:hypothetical protein n=1 Tax=Corynebacterium sp. 13CS0277 TaxID=2071994 RepID=UPI000D033B30|nr:hypothetical protein [Corynebacterium sp. 13CS0277]PRQ12196.1 hypothetical protein C1Y63_02480 [Corynebacterium sp. 13CS0277]